MSTFFVRRPSGLPRGSEDFYTPSRFDVQFVAVDAPLHQPMGHDFRPEYRQLALAQRFPTSLHAFTRRRQPRPRDNCLASTSGPRLLGGRFDRRISLPRTGPAPSIGNLDVMALASRADHLCTSAAKSTRWRVADRLALRPALLPVLFDQYGRNQTLSRRHADSCATVRRHGIDDGRLLRRSRRRAAFPQTLP